MAMLINKKFPGTFFKFLLIFLSILYACDSGKSSTKETVPDNDAPSVPSNLQYSANLSYRVGLQWTASTDNVSVTGYRVYRDGNQIGTSQSSSYSDSTVKANTPYTYAVAAYDAAGNISGQSGSINVTTPVAVATPTIIDHTCTDLSRIPEEWITDAKNTLVIAFNHTSHGSQIPAGMDALAAYPSFGTKYQWSRTGGTGLKLYCDWQGSGNPISKTACDLGYETIQPSGFTQWADATRAFLNNTANNNVNVIIWSWCSIRGHDIDRYIANMEALIAEYGAGGSNPRAELHPVEFVFMTGHTEALGEPSAVSDAASKIRAHCITNNRWLIDYYDLECYDPDGNYFGDKYIYDNLNYDKYGSKDANWATEYCNENQTGELYYLTMGDGDTFNGCESCAHSDLTVPGSPRQSTLNCVLKARAAWWLFARIAGWGGN